MSITRCPTGRGRAIAPDTTALSGAGVNTWDLACGAHATVGRRRYSTLPQPAAYIKAVSDGRTLVEWEEELSTAIC